MTSYIFYRALINLSYLEKHNDSGKIKRIHPPKNAKRSGAKRDDVLLKILLRSVKRFYCKICCESNNLIFPNQDGEEVNIFQKIDEVCFQRFESYFSEEERVNTPSLTTVLEPKFIQTDDSHSQFFQVKLMVACMTVRMIMKKYIGKCKLRKVYTKYYDVISKYSYKRLVLLLKIKPFQIVMKEFLESDDYQEMVR